MNKTLRNEDIMALSHKPKCRNVDRFVCVHLVWVHWISEIQSISQSWCLVSEHHQKVHILHSFSCF